MKKSALTELANLIDDFFNDTPIRGETIATFILHVPDGIFPDAMIQEAKQYLSHGSQNRVEFDSEFIAVLQGFLRAERTILADTTEQFDREPTFSLNSSEKKQIFVLTEQIRKIVLADPDFEFAHKNRLLDRITAVEKEVSKDKGRFDTILGMASDVGEMLGKFGKDIKPLTDRVNEITKITRNKTGEYDQLPAPDEVKAIEDKSTEEEE